MNLKHHFLLSMLSLALVPVAGALTATPAGINAGKLPDVAVWDEADIQHTLWEKLQSAGSGPVIVLPVYTRCTMSCPVLTHMLVQQATQLNGGAPFRVLIFSFDPEDNAESLRQFRVQKNLPPNWILVRSHPADIQRFCDFFHYAVITEGPVMIHTNQMFLLDHTFQWRATFIDESWNADELRTWMRRVESPGLFAWFATKPELLVYAGFCGMVLSLMLILGVLVLRPWTSVSSARSNRQSRLQP